MSDPTPRAPVGAARREQDADQVRAHFEAAWKEGRPPRIEDVLAGAGLGDGPLLRELVVLEIAYRRQRGEEVRPEEYQARFPELDAPWLDTTLKGEAALASASTQRPVPVRQVRCPHCH